MIGPVALPLATREVARLFPVPSKPPPVKTVTLWWPPSTPWPWESNYDEQFRAVLLEERVALEVVRPEKFVNTWAGP